MAGPFDAALAKATDEVLGALAYRVGYARGALGVALLELTRYQEGDETAFQRALFAIRDGLSGTDEDSTITWSASGHLEVKRG